MNTNDPQAEEAAGFVLTGNTLKQEQIQTDVKIVAVSHEEETSFCPLVFHRAPIVNL